MILADDQGYSDLSCTWQPDAAGAFPRIHTPRMDSLAADGIRFDQFYTAASVCTPSRAALLTGCYPPRVGFGARQGGIGVLGPGAKGGLAAAEVTLAEVLRSVGYATGCVGKWHLGGIAPMLPMDQGFDGFYGIPWSNNQHPLPLVHDREVLRLLPENPILTGQFTQAAISFIEQSRDRPFFLYLAHSAPHWPWNVAPGRRGSTERGIYGDAIAELDWSVGATLDALDHFGLSDNTLVIFFSDNGPYIDARTGLGGSNHPLRGGKSDSWEGGVRTPFLARWPGEIPAGVRTNEMATAMDLLPTLAAVAGAPLPAVAIDGRDIGALLRHKPGVTSPHDHLAYYARGRLEAVRDGRYKRVFENPRRKPAVSEALYDLQEDPGERVDVAATHPQVMASLAQAAEAFRADLGDALTQRTGTGVRSGGWQ
jgi:arylsulfatase A-like enzyme